MSPEDRENPELIKAAESIKSVLESLNVYSTATPEVLKHLKDTPLRIVTAWKEFTETLGLDVIDPTSFDEDIVDGIPIVRNIRFSSLCMHHFFPFTGIAHVAYLPDKKLIGLSKIPRIVKFLAKRPTLQEFLSRDIADSLFNKVKPQFVMVITKAQHTCCSSRGVESDSDMVFSTIRAKSSMTSEEVDSLKSEVLSLLSLG